MNTLKLAPPLAVREWLNTDEPITLESLRGKIVLIEAFQMLCPGCVSHALPQAMRVRRAFDPREVAVVGLHSVFEHHEAQGSRAALEAFLHEYRINIPVAIDASEATGGLPATMTKYAMKGTPTMILLDQAGYIRGDAFGPQDDLVVGAQIGTLLGNARSESLAACNDDGCVAPQA